MKKTHKKEPPTSKSRKKAEPSASLTMIVDYVFLIALKSILSSVVQHIPKEILKEGSQYINTIYPKLKDQILNTSMKDDTVIKREKVWGHVTNTNIEQKPLIQVPIEEKLEGSRGIESDDPMNDMQNASRLIPLGSNTLNHAIKAYAQSRSAPSVLSLNHARSPSPLIDLPDQRSFFGFEFMRRQAEKKNSQIYWPKPLEINFLQIKDADDVATIYCKIGGLIIPCAMIDTGSDTSIFSDNIAELVEELLGIKINRKKIHRLNGVASQSISIGTMDNVPVTIGSGENTASIIDDVSVVPAEKDRNGNAKSLVILGTQWQY